MSAGGGGEEDIPSVRLFAGILAAESHVQAAENPCAAPWEVTAAATRPASGGAGGGQEGGALVVKFNRCTGEAFVLSYDGPMLEQDDKNDRTTWRAYPTAGAGE